MNKKGQEIDFEGIIKLFFLGLIIIPLFGALFAMLNSMNCQKCEVCDYSPYQINISSCQNLVSNLTERLNQTPIKYIQNITYLNNTIEKPIYVDKPIPTIITIISFIFSIFATVNLFKIEIKLPEQIEKDLEEIEDWIKIVKWLSLGVTILIFIRLVWIFISIL